MKTSVLPRIRIALAALLFGSASLAAWSCACSTAGHATVSSGTGNASDGDMGLGSGTGTATGDQTGTGTGSGTGMGTGTGTGTGDQTTAMPGRGEQCGDGDACATGLQCLHYYGIAGPRGPELTSCETPCKDDKNACTDGTKCVKIADGPGEVCR